MTSRCRRDRTRNADLEASWEDVPFEVVLHGEEQPAVLQDPSLFLQNIFHSTVASLCFAAMGLKWYINSKDSPEEFVMTGYPSVVFEFVLYRMQMKELDEQYKAFSDWIEAHGVCPHGRWGG